MARKYLVTLQGPYELYIREKLVAGSKNDAYMRGHQMALDHESKGNVTDAGDVLAAHSFKVERA